MKKKLLIFGLLLLLILVVNLFRSPSVDITPSKDFVLEDYTGRWYEIARFDHRFERGCDCVYAEYSLEEEYVSVYNYCREKEDDNIDGKAFLTDTNGALKVQFFPPFKSSYNVIYYGGDVAMVSSGDNYLWFLARDTSISKSEVAFLESEASKRGFAVDELIYLGGCD